MPTIRGSRDGFTMIETMFTLTIFMLVLLGVYQVLDSGHSTYTRGTKKQDVQQTARLAMDEMVKRLRMAGYIPENFDTPNLAADIAPARFGVYVATSTVLAVYGDMDGTLPPPPTAAPALPWSNVFLYCFYKKDAADPKTWVLLGKKGTTTPPGTDGRVILANYQCNCAPLTDCTQSGDVLADNVTDLQFTYFDANNNQIVPPVVGGGIDNVGANPLGLPAGTAGLPGSILASTTNRQSIRTVGVKLQVSEAVNREDAQRYTLTSTIRLRNQN
ncbi:MAG: prepilin-type N-terminal cleavage/methylation domain-containing protein [candidate division NC10 bacterium]|nr:prepilin-type N-terminal cleavage/methylation domain-containing protein [candidate division NC10 bacterium]